MDLQVYIDETGVHDGASVTAVAAYFAHRKNWQRFERAWLSALHDFDIQDFHMVDYVQRTSEFRGWSGAKQLALGKRLFPLIPSYTKWGMSVAMIKREFDEGLRGFEQVKTALGDPYACCFQWLISLLASRLKDSSKEIRLELIHECNDYQADALASWNWVKNKYDIGNHLVSLRFAQKSQAIALQAADVFAWEAQKHLAEPERPERLSLVALRKNQSIELNVIGRQWLSENAARLAGLLQ